MHICLMTRSTLDQGVQGGMERHAADLCQALAARGHRVTVITTRHPEGKSDLRVSHARTLFLPNAPMGRYTATWWRESMAALARLHSEDPIDLVWSQSIGAYGYLRRPAGERPIPCVPVLHGTPLGEWRAMRRQWGLRPRHLYRLARFGARTLLFWRRFRVVSRRAAHIICVSSQVAEDALREFRLRSDAVTVIPNGVSMEQFAPDEAKRQALRSRLGLLESDFALLTAGRLEKAKGHHLALQVVAQLTRRGLPLLLLVAGGGPEEGWLQQHARALGIADRVRWLGRVPHEEMPEVYSAADVVLMLSIHTEALPYAVVEAMACGRPVVASRVGGVPSAIAHESDGFLVAPGDVAAAARQTEALARDAALRARVGQTAREKAFRRFSLGQMATSTEEVFRRHALGREARP